MPNERDVLRSVGKRVDQKLGFYVHLATYVLVNCLLIAIDLMTSPGTYWFIWPLIGWGIGVLVHGLSIFVFGDGLAIRQRMIEAEMKKQGHGRDEPSATE